MWIPKGERNPVVYLHPTRKGVGYFGAVRLRDGKFVYDRPDGHFDRVSFMRFIKKLRMTTARCNKTIVLLMDNAKYHHARKITEWIDGLDGKIVILFLPLYSPELNPIERVWKLVRRTTTHNRYFGALDELSGSVEDLFESWSEGNIILARLCA